MIDTSPIKKSSYQYQNLMKKKLYKFHIYKAPLTLFNYTGPVVAAPTIPMPSPTTLLAASTAGAIVACAA